MRILFLSQYYPPEPGAPAARVSEMAARWVAKGHSVWVLTGFPNHPSGKIPPEYRGRWFCHEEVAGVHVLRIPMYATPNRGVIRRSLAYGSFSLSAALLGPWWGSRTRADVVIATSPQFLVALSGDVIRRVLGLPWVLEIRDLWPQSIVDLGVLSPTNPITRLLYALERYVYRQADFLCGVSPAFARTWVLQGVNPAKIRTIENGVDVRKFFPRAAPTPWRHARGWGKDFVVAYIGTHGLAHSLETVLEAAAELQGDPSMRFVFIGDGARRAALEQYASKLGLERVEFLGSRPRAEIAEWISAADLLVVSLRDVPVFEHVIPSKIFEVMGCARPLVLAVRGEAADIVRAAQAGWIVEPQDSKAMARSILEARHDPEQCRIRGESGHAYVTRHYDRDTLADRYLEMLSQAVEATK